MRSARVRLPRDSTLFTTWVTRTDRYTGSGWRSRRGAGPLRGMSGLLLGAVAAACLAPLAHSGGVEGAPDHLVPHAGQVLHPTAADQHDRVLLEVVPDAGDVGRHLDPAREAYPRHLAQGRVGLLGRRRVDAGAHPPALGRALEGRRLRLGALGLTSFADELGDGGHA